MRTERPHFSQQRREKGHPSYSRFQSVLFCDVLFEDECGLFCGRVFDAEGTGDVAERLWLGRMHAEISERAFALRVGVVGVFEYVLWRRQIVLRSVLRMVRNLDRLRVVGQHRGGLA